MRILILISIFIVNVSYAKGTNDYGQLLTADKFSQHCVINDPGVSGSPTAEVYSNGQVSCDEIQKIYTQTYTEIYSFLSSLKYTLSSSLQSKLVTIRILSLAQLNNPDNFSHTDKKCMSDARCDSGAFFGRTFFSQASDNIDLYAVYGNYSGSYSKYSFVPTIKHELVHAILYRYGLNCLFTERQEHALISKFLRGQGIGN